MRKQQEMIQQVASRLRSANARQLRQARASSTAARVSTRSAPATAQVPANVGVRSSPSPTTTTNPLLQDAAPAILYRSSYGAWTHANPHLTRQERVEGLRKFMLPRGGHSERPMVPLTHNPTSTSHTVQPVAVADSLSISCAKQPRTRADRIAQIQRFTDATRAVGKIDYSQPEAETTPKTLDPIIVSPLPAGWRLSSSGGMSDGTPVFSYGEWLRSHDDSRMDRVTAARQFMRYVRQ